MGGLCPKPSQAFQTSQAFTFPQDEQRVGGVCPKMREKRGGLVPQDKYSVGGLCPKRRDKRGGRVPQDERWVMLG